MSAAASQVQRISKKSVSLANRLQRLRSGPASFAVPKELKELEMTFSLRNKDYGARKFFKNDLPSILYMNPDLVIKANRPETVENPEMVLRYANGTMKTIALQRKTDELIREELKEILNGTLPDSATQPITTASNPKAPQDVEEKVQEDAATPTGAIESGVDVGTARA